MIELLKIINANLESKKKLPFLGSFMFTRVLSFFADVIIDPFYKNYKKNSDLFN